MENRDEEAVYDIQTSACYDKKTFHLNATKGVIRGSSLVTDFMKNHTRTRYECIILITVPKPLFVNAWVTRIDCNKINRTLDVFGKNNERYASCLVRNFLHNPFDMSFFEEHKQTTSFIVSKHNTLQLHIVSIRNSSHASGDYEIMFEGVTWDPDQMRVLQIDSEIPSSGRIVLPGFDLGYWYPPSFTVYSIIHPDPKHNLLLSFKTFDLQGTLRNKDIYDNIVFRCINDKLILEVKEENGWYEKWTKCGPQHIPVMVFTSPIKLTFLSDAFIQYFGFEARYSNYLPDELSERDKSGMLNCSRGYNILRRHVECNLHVECQGGEDEHADCHYHDDSDIVCSPGQARVEVK